MSDTEYIISEEKAAMFEKMSELVQEFDRVCKKHNLRYFAIYGTLLGAIRHNGFIPWDDDVDIAMLRKDYEKLKQLGESGEFQAPFFFQNSVTDPGCPKVISRLRNSDTTEIPFDDVAMKCNQGIFIDIFPIDHIPDDEKKIQKQVRKMYHTRLIMRGLARYYSGFGMQNTTKIKKLAYLLSVPLFKCKILTMKKLYRHYEKIAMRYENVPCRKWGTFSSDYTDERCIWPAEAFDRPIVEHPFEKGSICIPENYDVFLRQTYGDYMTPVKAPTGHGAVVFSATVPYETYYEMHKEELIAKWRLQTEVPDQT